ncbi:LacI family transcriptional regulator [Octadecabacter antarcticus 307]|uniref:LacI family transcriptional regulator n=1 Tax=Octadecabacter antarcticus 307 TaxID=391626 RepID=M9RK30_9RHOB|nr:LacI family DNA-binding transcriptional regulator [Octadecabacter antarcticus]AGI70195.1 LacI family transcriptional regulator [Octadecabacter antarcticus 307]
MNLKRPAPTLHDVSVAAGVSTATVSRCLNFPDQVAKLTRDKVLSAIQLLGYSPNFGAKAMAARRTNTIGAIIPTMENAIFARGLEAFQEELRLHGFTMLVASTSYRPEIEEEQIRSLVARGADALLLIGHERDPEIYRFLETQGVPVLITWVFDAESTRPSVGFDNRVAMMEMAIKVIEFGHTELAFISAATARNDRATARLNGIGDAMIAAGLNADDLHCIETTYGIEEGAAAFDKLMLKTPRPTAVFCGNDVLAVGALRRARELKIAVPQDVSIIGFDDIELAQVAYPPLTTVHVPHREMGRRAGHALADHLKNGTPLKSVQLGTRPVLRETLAPVKVGS